MRVLVTLVAVAVAGVVAAVAGDELRFPELRSGSEHESSHPAYRLVGVEEGADENRAWVVADAQLVLSQRGVNRIVQSIRAHMSPSDDVARPLAVYFYRSVQIGPHYTAFRIEDVLARYDWRQDKTYFLTSETRGRWAYGPGREQSHAMEALSRQLRQLRLLEPGAPSSARCPNDAESLIDLKLELVRDKLGTPDFAGADPMRWTYRLASPMRDFQRGGGFPVLSFTFGPNGKVAEISCHYAR